MAEAQTTKRLDLTKWVAIAGLAGLVGYQAVQQRCLTCDVGAWLGSVTQGPQGGVPTLLADAAPQPWSITQPDGSELDGQTLSGHYVLINFWASWCPPCRAEMPDLVALQSALHDEGLRIVGANPDPRDREQLAGLARQWELNFPVGTIAAETTHRLGGVEVLPTTLLLDPQGRIVDRWEGKRSKAFFERAILGHMRETRSAGWVF